MTSDLSRIADMLPLGGSGLDWVDYLVDTSQRQILYWDVLRSHGNDFFQYLADGQPPVLYFPYEIVLDGRTFERPVNYALVRMKDRRRRGERKKKEVSTFGHDRRPVVVIDPRSGNAPGIGGSKRASEIGIALEKGHPVYYILFFPEPVPGQTLEDVKDAEIRFIEEVARLHPDSGRPSIIGNSQAGWAVALMSADRPSLAGPLVLNGSPISYWAGVRGRHVVRYKAGLTGGVWGVELASDLGAGFFDGANLASGHEALDPAEAYCRSPYNLYANVDTEADRFRDFSRWWSSYYLMTAEEIRFMIQHLFIENKLEMGEVSFQEGKRIDLRELEDPIVLFSSDGDNVTPPQQALNWILKVWGTLEEVKRQQQVIIYMVHENVGHIGLFVSDRVAKKEHAEIIGSIDMVDYLAPGLYEMIIEKGDPRYSDKAYKVRFEARAFEDIEKLDDGVEDELDFYPVAEISKINDLCYRSFFQPWIRSMVTPQSAAFMRMHHPQRFLRMVLADINPSMLPVKLAARMVRSHRSPAPPDNIFRQMEKGSMDLMASFMEMGTRMKDAAEEQLFTMVYSNPFVRMVSESQLNLPSSVTEGKPHEAAWRSAEDVFWREKITKGGFAEAVVRVLVAVAGADGVVHQEEITVLLELIRNHPKTGNLPDARIRQLVREQSRILELDPAAAMEALPILLGDYADRFSVVEMAQCLALSDLVVDPHEEKLLNRIMEILEV
ncbi:tellurite resistance protein TerB [Desulfobotulus alkaliphilus]|uniref:Tellurite resistance protein TerB n=1 Tax=Desulfobotulus alkaliphilus TaxID=622671 RepID=A0A562S247_9BACT|nr:DUF3141 domain-containing protein [Desulfobotulus alkaliphilus]TWI75399.1 tellurite resistance protein TerB [Desulfobotulus alkaliphilus]